MSSGEHRSQARAWARVARATAAAEQPGAGAAANRELFDAIEHAATDGRLDLRDLVDAYTAGVPHLDFSDAWDAVVDYLERISSVQASGIWQAHARVERALPDWRRRLGLRIAAHDLALAARSAAKMSASSRHASPSQTSLTARERQTPEKTSSTRSSSSYAPSNATWST
ncbi:MAG: hypothetical protein LC790_06655 [Actinobacteria bacterium]|nr:hypothetical protein [Actinomycetota bacterium]MCA1698587.1 hypothetical protein [Actinomycetota bacterium]